MDYIASKPSFYKSIEDIIYNFCNKIRSNVSSILGQVETDQNDQS